MLEKDKITIFNYAFDYSFGTLWWGREDFIHERFDGWCESNREGHPLLSLSRQPVKALCDMLPMLVGTSGKGKLTVCMRPGHKTDFSTHVGSSMIFADDFLFHEDSFKNPETSITKRRKIWRSYPKTKVDKNEEQNLEAFLAERKIAALQNGGYNK